MPALKVVAAGKDSEQKSTFTPEFKKLEFPLTPESLMLVGPAQFQLLPQMNTLPDSLMQQPLIPPPRLLFVCSTPVFVACVH